MLLLEPVDVSRTDFMLSDERTVTVSDPLEDPYDDHLLDHFESPYHKGHLPHPTCSHSDRNPICGDQVTVELLVDDPDRVKEAYFDGKGCAISQAAASILCQEIEGKSLNELKDFQAKQMLDLLKVRLTASRQKCGLLSFKVLKTMLYSLDQQGEPASSG